MNTEKKPLPASDLFNSTTSTNEDGKDFFSKNQEVVDSVQNVNSFFDNLSIKEKKTINKIDSESPSNKNEIINQDKKVLLKDSTESNSSNNLEQLVSNETNINKSQGLDTEKFNETNVILTDSDNLNTSKKEVGSVNLTSDMFSGPNVASALFETSDQSLFDNLVGSSTDGKDLFTSALSTSEAERRQQAWIPSKDVRKVLDNIFDINSKKSVKVKLSKPKVLNSQTVTKPINEQLQKYGIVSKTNSKNNFESDNISIDLQGFQKLVSGGNLYAALDLTTKVISKLTNQNIKQNITSDMLNWYNARFNLMFKLKLYSTLQSELELFNDFNTADFYFEFYPTLYPAKRGCMVPFTMRLLHAVLPVTVSTLSCAQSLTRLYKMKAVAEKILQNLDANTCEEGFKVQLNDNDKKESINLWSKRLIMILQAIANTLLIIKEYESSFEIYDKIVLLLERSNLSQEKKVLSIVNIHSCIGRSLLQLGDIKQAQNRFVLAEKASLNINIVAVQTVLVMNKGFLYLGANNWKESILNFNKAIAIDSTNIEAHNNAAVCLLYMCKLKDAIKILENAVYENKPLIDSLRTYSKLKQKSFEGVCANLVTSYELESSKHQVKRTKLLQHIAENCGDCFSIASLKL